MRVIIGLCAVVFLVTVGGSYYAGYRFGRLEASSEAQHATAAAPATTSATLASADAGITNEAAEPGEQQATDDSAVAHRYFAEVDASQAIAGEITIGDDLKKSLGKGFTFTKDDVVYIVASRSDLGAQPLAVTRLDHLEGKSLPLTFKIGPGDLMTQDRGAFSGDLTLKVKLSHTGDAKTSPGDLLGYPKQAKAVRPGAKGVTLVLSAVAT